jgi:hypothetical protein
MLRITGVNRHANPRKEFIALKNQSFVRVLLSGHAIAGRSAVDGSPVVRMLTDDVMIPSRGHVIIFSGSGDSRWMKDEDGIPIYVTFLGSLESIWNECDTCFHVLSISHVFEEVAHHQYVGAI